jgi:uncharacterized membrane protein
MFSDAFMIDLTNGTAKVFELFGISVIVMGTLFAAGSFALQTSGLRRSRLRAEGNDPVASFRKMLGRSILTGLELLVAADIIRTVVVEPTLESLAVLAGIVVIRTFLSYSLEVEIDGRWPWQKGGSPRPESDHPSPH